MKNYLVFLGVLALASALYAGGVGTSAQDSKAPRWQFQQIKRNRAQLDIVAMAGGGPEAKKTMEVIVANEKEMQKTFEADLKNAGADGWDLVAVLNVETGTVGPMKTSETIAFLKRPMH